MYNPAFVLGNEAENSLGFWDTNGLPNLGHTTRTRNNQQKKKKKKKKKKERERESAVPADNGVILKEGIKKDKFLDLARKLKKLWNIKVTVVPIVIGALGTATKWLVQRLEDWEIKDEWRPSKLKTCWDNLEY